MDIESMKKLLNRKIEVGKKVNEVREVIKNYNKEKRDMSDYTEELFKPSIKAQKDIKKVIDDKQDELINQLAINDEIGNMKQNYHKSTSKPKGFDKRIIRSSRTISERNHIPR